MMTDPTTDRVRARFLAEAERIMSNTPSGELPQAPLVSATTYIDPWRIFHTVHAIDADARRYWFKDIKVLGTPMERGYAFVTSVPVPGQICHVGNGNLRLVFEPEWGAKACLVVAEYGCEHDYTHTTPFNCYNEYLCSKCGFHWAVDSSD